MWQRVGIAGWNRGAVKRRVCGVCVAAALEYVVLACSRQSSGETGKEGRIERVGSTSRYCLLVMRFRVLEEAAFFALIVHFRRPLLLLLFLE